MRLVLLPVAGPDDAVLVREDRDLDSVAQGQLGQYAGHVALDRGLAEVELAAISAFDRPWATARTTSSSRSLR
jgi:hypothetical protein